MTFRAQAVREWSGLKADGKKENRGVWSPEQKVNFVRMCWKLANVDDLAEVMERQGVQLVTVAPPLPPPPPKLDTRSLTSVSEPPSRRRVQLRQPKPLPRIGSGKAVGKAESKAESKATAKDELEADAGASFFLTAGESEHQGPRRRERADGLERL